MEFSAYRDSTKSNIVDLFSANDRIQIVHNPEDLQYITILILLLSGLAQTSAQKTEV